MVKHYVIIIVKIVHGNIKGVVNMSIICGN